MVDMLSRADFKYIDPNWEPFEYLVQIAKFVEEKEQTRHHHGHVGVKQRLRFTNNGEKKTKRKFKEGDADGERETGLKPELQRRKKQRLTLNNNGGKKTEPGFKQEDEESESALKPELKSSKKHKPPSPVLTPDLPHAFKQHILQNMKGSGLVLLIQKSLFFSDVNPTASRLSIPFSQVQTHEFLNETEADELDHKNPMQVCLLDPSLEKTTVTLNRWKMGKTSLYVLTESWNSVVKNHRLKKGDKVQLWSFRMDLKLCFALLRV